jgi:hypothetical protein
MDLKKFQWIREMGFLSLLIRGFIYAVLMAGLAYGMLWGAVAFGEPFFDETGVVEILESVFAGLTALIFLFAGRSDRSKESCSVVVACFLFCLLIRESDYFLDELVFRHAWKILVTGVLLFLTFYTIQNMQGIITSVASFIPCRSFGIFMSGLLLVLFFSRFFGYGGFWEELIEGSGYRFFKTIAEEGTELVGYMLLLISSCEYLSETKSESVSLSDI